MKGPTKVMAVTAANRDKNRRDYDRTEMVMPYMGGDYDIQDRFRDRRGREHYDNGRYAPRSAKRGTLTWDNEDESAYRNGKMRYPTRIGYEYPNNDMDEMESRRRRDSRGRFRSGMDEPDMHYPGPYPFPPPVYEGHDTPRMIGFSAHDGPQQNNLHMIHGGAQQHDMKLDEKTAHEWMENLHNEDGTMGPHWTQDQTTQVMKKKGFDLDPIEFWAIMNAVYSDYSKVAKKYNVNNVDYYADLAKAWISDADAVDNKVAAYYCYIAK